MKKMHPIVWAILCLPVVYFAMVTASVYIPGENVFALLERFSTMVRRLDLLRWTAYTPRFLLVFLLLYGGGVLLYYADHENRRPGEEYGSAKWGSVRALNKKYADPKGKNAILTKRISIGLDGYRHQHRFFMAFKEIAVPPRDGFRIKIQIFPMVVILDLCQGRC